MASSGLAKDARGKAPERHLFSLTGGDGIEVDLGKVIYRRSNLDPYEQYALGALAKVRRPRRIFEIGTLFTLDLPPSDSDVATEEDEAAHVSQGGVGARFSGFPEASRITQLLGDSRSFDFTPWHASVDLVLVDAGHEYDAAKADSNRQGASLLQLQNPSIGAALILAARGH